jgi:predicted phage terminase large subunit-like protein
MSKKRSQIDKIKFLDQEIEFLLNQQKYLNASNSLYDFLKVGFDYVEPNEFRDSRLVGALCEHLEAIMSGQIKRLIINISPRTIKTLLTGVYFPAYWWLKKPYLKFIYCSYTATIAEKCSEKNRALVQHDYYKKVQSSIEEYTENPITLKKNTQEYYNTNYGGERSTVGIGGSITGVGADVIILDDPLKAKDAYSATIKKRTNDFIQGTLINRLNKTSEEKVVILIQQRLAENDPSGFLREQGGYDILELPLLFTGVSNSSTKLGFKDWRKTPGEILIPELMTMEDVLQLEEEMGTIEFERQCQQNVKGQAGNIISNKYFKEYQNAPPYDQYILAADLAESVQDDACFTGLVVFGIYEGRYYVVDVVEKRLGFDDQILEVKKLLAKYPISYKLIEKKSMGAALINVLSKEIPGIIALEPKDYGNEKENRLKATLPAFMAGKIYFPTKESCEKIESLKDQIVTFPLTRYDDVMDAFCYGILWLERNGKIASIEESQVIIPEHIKQRRNIFNDTPPSKIFGSVSNNRFRF